MFPAFVAAQDFNLDAQKEYRHIAFRQARKSHRVFFGRDDHLQIAANATGDEAVQLRFGVAVVIGVALRKFETGPEFLKPFLETFWRGDAANGPDVGIAQTLERNLLSSEDVLQMERPMRALNNFRGAIVAPDAPDQLVVRLASALGNEDATGTAKIA